MYYLFNLSNQDGPLDGEKQLQTTFATFAEAKAAVTMPLYSIEYNDGMCSSLIYRSCNECKDALVGHCEHDGLNFFTGERPVIEPPAPLLTKAAEPQVNLVVVEPALQPKVEAAPVKSWWKLW